MGGSWRERCLGEVTDNFDSSRVPVNEPDRRPGPYPYYGASGVVDHVDGYLFDGEYLLIAEDGENLRTRNTPIAFLARGKFWVNNHAHIVRGNSEANTRYLLYALQAADIGGYLTGSTMPKLTQGAMNRILVPVPAPREQRAIAQLLGALDDKIELNRRMNETLESMARAIFRSWFVDFDPPEGNATRIGDLIRRGYLEVGDGYRAKNSELASTGLPFARAGNLKAGFDFCGADCFPAERISAVGAKVSRPGDVVFTSKGTVGRLAYVHVSTPQFVYSPQLCYWRVVDPGVIDSRWLYRWMQFGDFRDQCDEVKGQTDMADYVSLRDQQTMCLSLPDISIQRGLGDVLGSLGDQVELHRRMNDTLAVLRDALLPKLMSGELRVRVAEKLVGAHV
jgi:type I restriction enzyme S subunit